GTTMRFTALAVTAFAALAAAKRGCRHDHKNPGYGWYWVVQGDSLNAIAKDLGDNAQAIQDRNIAKIPDVYRMSYGFTIYVKCP
ncbi:hypothetical protein E4U61_004082, partial [Claviceps capensis]